METTAPGITPGTISKDKDKKEANHKHYLEILSDDSLLSEAITLVQEQISKAAEATETAFITQAQIHSGNDDRLDERFGLVEEQSDADKQPDVMIECSFFVKTSTCGMCQNPFNLGRWRHWCGHCGANVCSECCQYKIITCKNPCTGWGHLPTIEQHREICKSCIGA